MARMKHTKETLEAVQAAIMLAGGAGKIAERIRISRWAVSKWQTAGVPAERVLILEQMSGVSRSMLRPDIYPAEVKRVG